MRFGEGMQPGTVEAEMLKRRIRKERKEDERLWVEIEARRQAEERSIRGRMADFVERIRMLFPR